MSPLEAKVRQARARLTLGRWLGLYCGCLTATAVAYLAIVLAARGFGWSWPLGWIAAGLAVFGIAVSATWTMVTRVSMGGAAAALDEAAGLRERISSGMYFRESGEDPFVRAVVWDAERASEAVTVKLHLGITRPRGALVASLAIVAAAGSVMLPSGWLAEAGAKTESDREMAERTAALVRQRTAALEPLAKSHPELRDAIHALETAGEPPDARSFDPKPLTRDALKKLDTVQDVLKRQQGSEKFENAREFKKRLRALRTHNQPESPTQQLSRTLAQGDFKSAKNEIQKLQESLAKLTDPNDAQKLQEMSKQLEALAKKLESLSHEDQLAEELRQAGVKPEAVERLLKQLSKKDIDQLKRELEKQGLDAQKIEQLAKQLQRSQSAGAMAKQLGDALAQAGQAAGQGSAAAAAGGMGSAADQLSEMEILEQEMNQLESAITEVQADKDSLSNPCSQCRGTGKCNGKSCGRCGGSGCRSGNNSGMGQQMGRGRGGLAEKQETTVDFVKEREKAKSGPGAIIGQFLVDAEQVEGEAAQQLQTIVEAARRDATESVNRARVPRRYHDAVKKYFSDMERSAGGGDRGEESNGTSADTPDPSGPTAQEPDEPTDH